MKEIINGQLIYTRCNLVKKFHYEVYQLAYYHNFDISRNRNSTLYIGFDSEWVEQNNQKVVLSYQCVLLHNNTYLGFIFYPTKKLLLSDIFREIIRYLKVGDKNRVDIDLCCHLSSADLSSLRDFIKISKFCNNVKRNIFNINKIKYPVYLGNSNIINVFLSIKDTYLLSNASLKNVGNFVGINKIELNSYGYNVNNMLELLNKNKKLFVSYGLVDSLISLKYYLMVINNCDSTIGLKSVYTIPQLSCDYALKIGVDTYGSVYNFYKQVFGLTTHDSKLKSRKHYYYDKGISEYLDLWTSSVRGGRNECYRFGLYDGKFYDIDMKSAYGLCMSAIKNVDFSRYREMTNDDIKMLDFFTPGVADIDFEFPENTIYPCLPVSDKYGRGIIYPLSGNTTATFYEIKSAYLMGCKIKINRGVVYEQFDDYYLRRVVKYFNNQRSKFEKSSFENGFFKLLCNSIYGKLGQGLKGKRSFNVSLMNCTKIPASKISHVVYASLTSAMCRSIISLTMYELNQRGYDILSVTTDGFITNADSDVVNSLNLFGIKGFLVNVLRDITCDTNNTTASTLYECKHIVNDMLLIKTRIQCGVGFNTSNDIAVCSGYSFKNKDNKVQELRDLFFSRGGSRVTCVGSRLPGLKDLILNGQDFVMNKWVYNKSFEYDFKRFVDINSVETYNNHVRFKTKPFKNIYHFQHHRNYFDKMRVCIKSKEDIMKHYDKYMFKNTYPSIRICKDGVGKTIAKQIISAIRQGYLKCLLKRQKIIDLLSKTFNCKISFRNYSYYAKSKFNKLFVRKIVREYFKDNIAFAF